MTDDQKINERTATDLVRYALACHASGKPIKREGIRAQVLTGASSRGFKPLMDRANELLEQNFGLRMVALPSHEKTLVEIETATTATPTNTQQKANGPKAAVNKWVLQSVLPDEARQKLELAQTEEEQSILGFAAMVLSLIFVSNMSVNVDQLILYVRKLGPPACISAPADSRSAPAHASDAQMEQAAREAISYLVRQGYVDKVRLASAGRHTVGETQATQQADGGGGGESDEGMVYTWGPQARVEFQPLDMARFIAAATGQECTSEFVKTIGRAYGSNIAEP
ncbi:hypothetical protein GGI04_002891 [Coemansia thaxteri]|nr:hypothetical protein GGI04_002891 [Coemansia thaxteri]